MIASVVCSFPAQAFAASKLRVTASARSVARAGSTSKVLVSSKSTRPARFVVTVYKNGKAIRTIRPKGMWYRRAMMWNLRDARGAKVSAGAYRIKVTVRRGRTAVSTSKWVRVTRRTPPARVTPTMPATPVSLAPTPAYPSATAAPAAASGRWFGLYQSGAPASMDPLVALESQLPARMSVVNFYVADSEGFPLSRCESIVDHGSIPMVTLEFWSIEGAGLQAITSGSKDAYLEKFADNAKAFGGEVWLRPFHEMNGNWYPWGGTVNNNSPAELVAAWRHVQTIFAQRGASNVKFAWCVNNDSVPNTAVNSIESYWPGDAYVDYVALDGYNWGTTQAWSDWRSFSSVFGDSYQRVASLTSKPMFIAETACAEQGGSKSAWITDMYKQIAAKYTRISGVCWFNTNKECDWRVESSAASLDSYRAAMVAGY